MVDRLVQQMKESQTGSDRRTEDARLDGMSWECE